MSAMLVWTDAPSVFLLSAPSFGETPKAALTADAREASEILSGRSTADIERWQLEAYF
jgi:hypothetical protein